MTTIEIKALLKRIDPVIVLFLAILLGFSMLRLNLDILDVSLAKQPLLGNLDRNLDRIWDLALERSSIPFVEVRDHLLFHGRNPGLFFFIVELYQRAGGKTPLGLQLLLLGFWSIGFIAFFTWIREWYNNRSAAVIASVFLFSTSALLPWTTGLHTDVYDFLFLNLLFLAYVKYLRTDRHRYLIYGWLAYFLLCQSYYMYYISAAIMLTGMMWHEKGKIRARPLLFLGLAPALAFTGVILQVAYAFGWQDGVFKLAEIFVARTWDQRLPGTTWYPDQHFVSVSKLIKYPVTLNRRFAEMATLPFFAWMLLTLASAGKLWKRSESSRRLAVFLLASLLAAASWNLLMLQHTIIHPGSAKYGTIYLAIISSVLVAEWMNHAVSRLKLRFPETKARAIAMTPLLAVVIYGITQSSGKIFLSWIAAAPGAN